MNPNTSRFTRFLQLIGLSAALSFTVPLWGGDDSVPPDPHADLLAALTAYYDTGESEVIDRLAREAEARESYKPIRNFLGKAYAGAWFDGEALELAVALTAPELTDQVRRFGARPVLVERSLDELEAIQRKIETEAAADPDLLHSMDAWFIDHSANRVVVEVPADRWNQAQDRLHKIDVDSSALELRASKGLPRLAREIRGAECYENPAFSDLGTDSRSASFPCPTNPLP